MIIIKFRIRNYKSIDDSGDCYLTDTVNVLAGKNESGKTSILEALEDFDTDREIREGSIPIHRENVKPEISILFEMDCDQFNEVLKQLGLKTTLSEDVKFEVTKSYPDKYTVDRKALMSLGVMEGHLVNEYIKEITKLWAKVGKLHEQHPELGGTMFELDFDAPEKLLSNVTEFKKLTSPNIAQIVKEEEKNAFTSSVNELLTKVTKLVQILNLEVKFTEILKNEYIPYFILFNTFEDIFPNEIPFTELDSNPWIKDLSIISDLNVSMITSDKPMTKQKHKSDINVNLNKDYERFWSQDLTGLTVDWDSEKLYFWINEEGHYYPPSLRSKGRQWHLGFYIRVSARAKERVPNIILIDEPGLFLHAKAQKDILCKLEDAAKDAQLIFSTHSPYLLEADHLERIRLVHRDFTVGTKIENKVHALSDKETLTPIMTAIGLELSAGITNVDKKCNVVVEGPSDMFYLQAFKIVLKETPMNFVFGGGAGNMPIVGTILNGWGCDVIYLFDNDQGKKDGEKNLKKNWFVSSDLILAVIEEKGKVEDILSNEDFRKYVLCDESESFSGMNSTYVKKSGRDKVLLAKCFLELVKKEEEIVLSETSIRNISTLFENVNSKFK